MSIEVKNLVKNYGTQVAVDHINFKANPGEVLGFLGPNGAGKSTTMKMITCFLQADEGDIVVNGLNVNEHSMEIRAMIGYLPEHNPLYKDMYVKEYLSFIGNLHKIPNLKQRIDQVIQMTGLELEQKKIINSLSKGYRQRVGLAQAVIHDPKILILDEPTTGLDPNQLVEIRKLIKDLGKEKTVIFSTHIMQEVSAICDRVVIINRGKIVADDPIDQLKDKIKGEIILTVEFSNPVSINLLKEIKGVKKVVKINENRFQIISNANDDLRKSVSDLAQKNNWTLLEIHRETASVEDIFQQLTKS